MKISIFDSTGLLSIKIIWSIVWFHTNEKEIGSGSTKKIFKKEIMQLLVGYSWIAKYSNV